MTKIDLEKRRNTAKINYTCGDSRRCFGGDIDIRVAAICVQPPIFAELDTPDFQDHDFVQPSNGEPISPRVNIGFDKYRQRQDPRRAPMVGKDDNND
jgi:hypothetical protein